MILIQTLFIRILTLLFLFSINLELTCLTNAKFRDEEQQSSQIYRRMTSREDANATDVFSRLGAGQSDPIPGGTIREYSGKVNENIQKSICI